MRASPLIEYSSTVLILCLWIGAITSVFSSLIGLFQQDIKKVIAYSTMSQLARECNTHSITFRHRTICAEVIFNILNQIINMINSQITKAHDYLINSHNSYNLFNSSLIHWLYYYILKFVIMSVRWKIIIICKLVGISEAIRLILIFIKFNLINLSKFLFSLILQGIYVFIEINQIYYCASNVKISANDNINTNATIQVNNSGNNVNNDKDLPPLKRWLACLRDGDGYFLLTKKGYNSCEITMDARDKKALYEIKHKYGGSIKQVSNANAYKYKLRHRAGLILLIKDVNGLIRNPTRLLQMNKPCARI